ncbi:MULTISPECIES: DUF3649 domain-containing protein [unclassified Pseudomonas]|uniref:DUF3649 domain-containing protein n=1 Tax=unclassified Pseudomonas TaxID=196821 RepID=UPI0005BB5C64|nr:DUF3649 domain-containing protein [Pseudomonas sp. M47T1]
MKAFPVGLPVAYRLGVCSRIVAAALGGYVLASLLGISLAALVPMARAEAMVSGMMLSFLAYVVAVLWCFACRSAGRAWLGMMVPSLALVAVNSVLYWLRQS